MRIRTATLKRWRGARTDDLAWLGSDACAGPHVIDIRTIGLMAGIEFEPRPGRPGERGYDALVAAFEQGLLIRLTGDIIALSPPLVVTETDMQQLFGILRRVLSSIA